MDEALLILQRSAALQRRCLALGSPFQNNASVCDDFGQFLLAHGQDNSFSTREQLAIEELTGMPLAQLAGAEYLFQRAGNPRMLWCRVFYKHH